MVWTERLQYKAIKRRHDFVFWPNLCHKIPRLKEQIGLKSLRKSGRLHAVMDPKAIVFPAAEDTDHHSTKGSFSKRVRRKKWLLSEVGLIYWSDTHFVKTHFDSLTCRSGQFTLNDVLIWGWYWSWCCLVNAVNLPWNVWVCKMNKSFVQSRRIFWAF